MTTMLLSALTGLMLQPATLPAKQPEAIIVTGRRLTDYHQALRACLARNCPPNEDIDATMALAEALFIEGKYREARAAVRGSLSRNRSKARDYPEPVSDLYRANARIARNIGMDTDAARSTWEVLRTLKNGIPVEDHRHFTARLEIAQALQSFGKYDQAKRELRTLAEKAQAAGRRDVVIGAELRSLWIAYLEAPMGSAAVRQLNDYSRSPDLRRSIGAKMLLIRIHSERGAHQEAERLIADLGQSSEHRILLHNPPFQLAQRADVGATQARDSASRSNGMGGAGGTKGFGLTANLVEQLVNNFDDDWIDVGFWVRPNGEVEDLEIVRQRNEASWAKPLLASIRKRRYAPSDGENTYRLERYTYTAAYAEAPTGTRTSRRSPNARIEYFDLSQAPGSARQVRSSERN